MLDSYGYDIVWTGNAGEAHELGIRKNFDLVLLEIQLGGFFDGVVVFESIRYFRKDLKVIVSSNCPVDEQKQRIPSANGYFHKSGNRYDLLSMITEVLQDVEPSMSAV